MLAEFARPQDTQFARVFRRRGDHPAPRRQARPKPCRIASSGIEPAREIPAGSLPVRPICTLFGGNTAACEKCLISSVTYRSLSRAHSASIQNNDACSGDIAPERGRDRLDLLARRGEAHVVCLTRGHPPHSVYEARAAAAGLTVCFTAPIRVFAAGPDEVGFCPVISKPSLTT